MGWATTTEGAFASIHQAEYCRRSTPMTHSSTTSELKDELRAAGLRATGSRVGVLRSVRGASRPVALADVMEHLGEEAPDRATVYRNLLDLAEVGLLRRAHLGDAWRFEGGDESEHAHFICTQCGTVECAPDVSLKVSAHGKAPDSVKEGDFRVQLHGVCNRCS
ncbi:MAG: Fur family ferric uptake transcriptional regulator [Polyangiales bacterium]|jgi:Fur family ferric uptake transcriptional regulator